MGIRAFALFSSCSKKTQRSFRKISPRANSASGRQNTSGPPWKSLTQNYSVRMLCHSPLKYCRSTARDILFRYRQIVVHARRKEISVGLETVPPFCASQPPCFLTENFASRSLTKPSLTVLLDYLLHPLHNFFKIAIATSGSINLLSSRNQIFMISL